MDPLDFARLVLEPERLAVAGAIVRRPRTATAVAEALDLRERDVLGTFAALRRHGLVTVRDGRYQLDAAALRAVAAVLPHAPPPSEAVGYGMTSDERQVLGRFFRGERLVELPAQRTKRLVVLERLALEFEPGGRYVEAEVDDVLGGFHDDVASLRRALVDEGFLERARGVYWRAGGRVVVD